MDSKKLAIVLVLCVVVVFIENSEAFGTGMTEGKGKRRELYLRKRSQVELAARKICIAASKLPCSNLINQEDDQENAFE